MIQLSCGLNFAPASQKVPIPEIVSAAENGLRKVNKYYRCKNREIRDYRLT